MQGPCKSGPELEEIKKKGELQDLKRRNRRLPAHIRHGKARPIAAAPRCNHVEHGDVDISCVRCSCCMFRYFLWQLQFPPSLQIHASPLRLVT